MYLNHLSHGTLHIVLTRVATEHDVHRESAAGDLRGEEGRGGEERGKEEKRRKKKEKGRRGEKDEIEREEAGVFKAKKRGALGLCYRESRNISKESGKLFCVHGG